MLIFLVLKVFCNFTLKSDEVLFLASLSFFFFQNFDKLVIIIPKTDWVPGSVVFSPTKLGQNTFMPLLVSPVNHHGTYRKKYRNVFHAYQLFFLGPGWRDSIVEFTEKFKDFTEMLC